MLSGHLLSTVLLTPFVGALSVVCMKGQQRAIKYVATAFAIAAFLLSTLLWTRYDASGPTWQFAERIDLLSTSSLTFALGVDGFGILLVTLTTLIGAIAVLASWNDAIQSAKSVFALMLVLEASAVGVVVTTNLLLYFIFSILAMLTVIFLAASWSGARRRSVVSRLSLQLSIAGIALLIGILLLGFHARSITGVMTFDMVPLLELTLPVERQTVVFVSLFIGFALLMAMVPVHTWLCASVEDAPVGGVLFLVAVVLKLGTYGLMRISLPLLPDATRVSAPFIIAFAAVALLGNLAMAFRQRAWKPVVAYSGAAAIAASVIAMFRLTPKTVTASVLQQSDQALVLGAFLLVVGLMNRHRDTAQFGRLQNPRLVLAFLVLVMAVSTIWTLALSRTESPVVQSLLETSVGRVVARVNPAYAPLVKQPSDCGAPAAPVQPSSSAPTGWVITQPCADAAPTTKPAGQR